MLPDILNIGQNIHKRRNDFGLSLRDLAKKTNLTASFLSQIERGIISPSLSSLGKISEALEVSLSYFLMDPSKSSPVVRANERININIDNFVVRYQLLTPENANKMEAVLGTLESCTGNATRPLPVPTEEFIFILSGSLYVVLENESYTLNPGDSIYFEGPQLKELSCASEEKVTWISIISPPVF